MNRVENKVAIVTGGASGIGAGVARALAAEGADVGIVDLDAAGAKASAADIAASSGRRVIAVPADITEAGAAEQIVESVTGELRRLDILVNCAGIFVLHPFLEFPAEAWDQTIAVNLTGAMRLTQAACRRMAASGGGAVVNITSLGADLGGAGAAAYSASKGGLKALTHVLAVELAPQRIRVNAVSPHAIDTPMTAGLKENPELGAHVLAGIPAGRFGQPADIAAAVVYLASDEASFVTGATIAVQGGAGVQIF
jgi:NAD(P)-dependent dehydrogenase (short-subunit alcohol dehydrogenase family)